MGGGPPARSPHASLRLGVIDLEARPGPAAAHGHRSQAFRRPPHQWGWGAEVARCVGLVLGQALPPPTGTAAWPSGPSGALHTSGAGALMCGFVRRLEAWPGLAIAHGRRSWVLRTPNVVWLVVLGFWGAPLCVVTNVVNRRCFSCGFLIRCYKRRQSEGFFAENQGFWTQIDDVCNMSTRKGVQIASV